MSASPTNASRIARTATIIHGYAATPRDHWFGWLAEQLESVGINTTVPALPDSDAPNRDDWSRVIETAVGIPDDSSIIIAHSLGCLTTLRHLNSLTQPWQLNTLILISGFVDTLPAIPALDSYIHGAVDTSELSGQLATMGQIGTLAVFRSDADAYVPTEHTDHLADMLGVSAHVIPGAGHFLAADGVTTVPYVLDSILSSQ